MPLVHAHMSYQTVLRYVTLGVSQINTTANLLLLYDFVIQKVCGILTLRKINYSALCINIGGPGSSVGIATGYGLDGPGIESRWGARFSAPV